MLLAGGFLLGIRSQAPLTDSFPLSVPCAAPICRRGVGPPYPPSLCPPASRALAPEQRGADVGVCVRLHRSREEVYICASLGGVRGARPSPGGQVHALLSLPLPTCLLPCPLWVSLYFPNSTLHRCGEGAFDIHNLVQRRSRSPESLYGFHGNRLVRRTRCSTAVVGEKGNI